MKSIVTLTTNPAIDGSCEAERIMPTRKIRTTGQRYDPGGGGINVARVAQRLGGDVRAVYLAGGATGGVLDGLLDRDAIARRRIDIADHTRIALAVHERETGLEYRFVPEGPQVGEAEWQAALKVVAKLHCDYLVLSGSLPRGVPDDFYGRVIAPRKGTGCRIVLDTSGRELKATLDGGGVFLVKPSRGELEQFAGHPLADDAALVDVAGSIVRGGGAEFVAVTMGHLGAMLVSSGGVERLPAPQVEVRSAVGAGDSFVGAMTFALAANRPISEAFRLGVAAGSAALLSSGTGLCRREDVERLYSRIRQ